MTSVYRLLYNWWNVENLYALVVSLYCRVCVLRVYRRIAVWFRTEPVRWCSTHLYIGLWCVGIYNFDSASAAMVWLYPIWCALLRAPSIGGCGRCSKSAPATLGAEARTSNLWSGAMPTPHLATCGVDPSQGLKVEASLKLTRCRRN